MEKEGLSRAVQQIEADGLQIDTIVSDRHPQTQKWLREKRPDTNHYFDVWHRGRWLTNRHHCE